jgi:hypothetical protein
MTISLAAPGRHHPADAVNRPGSAHRQIRPMASRTPTIANRIVTAEMA